MFSQSIYLVPWNFNSRKEHINSLPNVQNLQPKLCVQFSAFIILGTHKGSNWDMSVFGRKFTRGVFLVSLLLLILLQLPLQLLLLLLLQLLLESIQYQAALVISGC